MTSLLLFRPRLLFYLLPSCSIYPLLSASSLFLSTAISYTSPSRFALPTVHSLSLPLFCATLRFLLHPFHHVSVPNRLNQFPVLEDRESQCRVSACRLPSCSRCIACFPRCASTALFIITSESFCSTALRILLSRYCLA